MPEDAPLDRPVTLAEVAQRTASERDWFRFHLSEFLDEFYLDSCAKDRQLRIEEKPEFLGDAEIDAWLCAAAEHLAETWGLEIPYWADDDAGWQLRSPAFSCSADYPSLRGVLQKVSPPAFRRRKLFVEPEALTRARTATAGGRPG